MDSGRGFGMSRVVDPCCCLCPGPACHLGGASPRVLLISPAALGRPGAEPQQMDSGTASSLDTGKPVPLKAEGGDVAIPTWAVPGSKTCLVIRSSHLSFRRSVFSFSQQEMRFRELTDVAEATQPQTAEPSPGS